MTLYLTFQIVSYDPNSFLKLSAANSSHLNIYLSKTPTLNTIFLCYFINLLFISLMPM